MKFLSFYVLHCCTFTNALQYEENTYDIVSSKKCESIKLELLPSKSSQGVINIFKYNVNDNEQFKPAEMEQFMLFSLCNG